MARPGLQVHPKFRRLVHTLGEPVPHVLGYLECMWLVGYESGNPVLGDHLDVELAAQYPGKPGTLHQALLDCRFIDVRPDGRFQIHDLHENAPSYVEGRAKREEERKKVKYCSRCGVEFHSPETHAKYCTPACRQASYRDRGEEDVTHRDGAVRNSDGQARNGDEPPDGALRTVPVPSATQPLAATVAAPVALRAVTGRYEPPAPAPILNTSAGAEESATPTPKPPMTANEFMVSWNGVATLRSCRKMTDARKKNLRVRLTDPSWVSSWREALDRIAKSPFCCGENLRGWRADVDWFLRPDTVTKVMEGKYDPSGNGQAPPKETEDSLARIQADRERTSREREAAERAGGLKGFAAAMRSGGAA
jgi:hypothetical protein